jgi:hypothetical protein
MIALAYIPSLFAGADLKMVLLVTRPMEQKLYLNILLSITNCFQHQQQVAKLFN